MLFTLYSLVGVQEQMLLQSALQVRNTMCFFKRAVKIFQLYHFFFCDFTFLQKISIMRK